MLGYRSELGALGDSQSPVSTPAELAFAEGEAVKAVAVTRMAYSEVAPSREMLETSSDFDSLQLGHCRAKWSSSARESWRERQLNVAR